MTPDASILTTFFNAFIDVMMLGLSRLIPDALGILALLLIAELALLGLWSVYGDGPNLVGLVTKGIGAIVLTYLIRNWAWLTKTTIRGFIALGLKGGGDDISITDFTDPGNIAFYGISATAVLFNHLLEYNAIDAMKNLAEIIIGVPIGLGILIAYFLLAIWIFVTQLDFYAHACITVVLIPFGLNSKVSFIAEKAIAVIFASAVRLLVLSFITAVALPIMQRTQGGLNPTLKMIAVQLLAALAILLLAWRADKSAQGLLGGTPQLSQGDVQRLARSSIQMASRVGQVIQMMHTMLGAGRPSSNGSQGQGTTPQRRRP